MKVHSALEADDKSQSLPQKNAALAQPPLGWVFARAVLPCLSQLSYRGGWGWGGGFGPGLRAGSRLFYRWLSWVGRTGAGKTQTPQPRGCFEH